MTKTDIIRNEYVSESLSVTNIVNKMRGEEREYIEMVCLCRKKK